MSLACPCHRHLVDGCPACQEVAERAMRASLRPDDPLRGPRPIPPADHLPPARLLEVAAAAEAGRAIRAEDVALLGAWCLRFASQLDAERQRHQETMLSLDAAEREAFQLAEELEGGIQRALERAAPKITGKPIAEVVADIGRNLAEFPDPFPAEPTRDITPQRGSCEPASDTFDEIFDDTIDTPVVDVQELIHG